MTRREWCMSSEAFYYPSVLMEAAGCSLAPQVASSQGCSPVSLCRLASCRAAVAHPFEPGTLITALSRMLCWQLDLLPSCSVTSNDCFSFIRISLCYRRRRLFSCSSVPSLFGNAFAAGFTLPLLVRLPSVLSASLRPRSLLFSALRVVVYPIYLYISSICLLPSRPF
jgi:hypothetical protein